MALTKETISLFNKISSIVLIIILVLNIILFAMKKTSMIAFWITILIIFIASKFIIKKEK
jgi:hypothetical protein